jgi:hypothetical protein
MPNNPESPGSKARHPVKKGLILLAGSLFFSSCGTGEKLPFQAPADLIKIVTMAGAPRLTMKEIREKDKVAALVSFVNGLPNRWTIPWYGTPVGRVYFQFVSGGKGIGNFFVGPDFIGRESGKIYSQGVGRGTIEEVGKIIGFDLWHYVSSVAPPALSVASSVPTPANGTPKPVSPAPKPAPSPRHP